MINRGNETNRMAIQPGNGGTMRHLNENLLVRFTVLGGVIMVSFGVLISVVVTSRLNQNLAALETAGAETTSDLLDAQDLC